MEKQYLILLVDDDETFRTVIAADLKGAGYSVITASNGVEAFELLLKTEVHIVVSDMRMAGGDGDSLLKRIRSEINNPPEVIFVTGFSDFGADAAIAKGARQVVAKPFRRHVLLEAVATAVAHVATRKTA